MRKTERVALVGKRCAGSLGAMSEFTLNRHPTQCPVGNRDTPESATPIRVQVVSVGSGAEDFVQMMTQINL